MQFAPHHAANTRRISLTPLIDIVFILLLFFILETNFLSFGVLELAVPSPDAGGVAKQEVVVLQVFASGDLWLSGRSHDLGSLQQYLIGRGYGSDTLVVLETEDSVPVQRLVDIIDVFRHQQLLQVQIVALQE